MARERIVERKLGALLAHVVNVGAPDDMGQGFPGRVETVIGTIVPHAFDVQRVYTSYHVRRHAARQIGELAPAAIEAPLQGIRRYAERIGEAAQIGGRQVGGLRVDPNEAHRRAHGQRLAVAIEYHATVDRHLDRAHRTGPRPVP